MWLFLVDLLNVPSLKNTAMNTKRGYECNPLYSGKAIDNTYYYITTYNLFLMKKYYLS